MPLEALAHRVRPPAGDPAAALVLLHGRGTDEHDLFPLLDYLDPERRLIGFTPRAPLQLPPGGNHWYISREVGYPDPDTFRSTFDLVAGWLDELPEATGVPWQRTVLGGFSQGAAAVSMLAGVPPIGQRIGNFGSAPALDPGLAGKVRAVAVFGNPGNRFNTPLSSTGAFAGRAIDLCSPGDPVCVVGGRDRDAHHGYESAPYPGQAAGFIAGLV